MTWCGTLAQLAGRPSGAADYLIPGYWLWAKVIQNLADIGYDSDDMLMACYDWRLAFPILETRDKFLSELKWGIVSAARKDESRIHHIPPTCYHIRLNI